MRARIGRILLGQTHVDRSAFTWRRPLVAAAVGAILVVVAIAAGAPAHAIPLAAGSLLVGIAGGPEPQGDRWRIMLWATVWVTFGATLGGLVSNASVWELLVVAVVAAGCGFVGVMGPRAAVVGVLTLVVYAVFAGTPDSHLSALETGALVALGALVQVVVAVIPVAITHPRAFCGAEAHLGSLRSRLMPHLKTDDEFFRHGARLALAMVVASLAGHFSGLPHQYWIPMTVAWISRPDRHGTTTKALARVLGTLAGVALSIIVIEGLHVQSYGIAILVGIGSFVLLAFIWANYTIAVVGITLMMIALFTLVGDPVGTTAISRTIATVIAGVITVLAALTWPARPPAPGNTV